MVCQSAWLFILGDWSVEGRMDQKWIMQLDGIELVTKSCQTRSVPDLYAFLSLSACLL